MNQTLTIKDRFYTWASSKIHSRLAPVWLFLIFLSEMFLFIPLDPLLMLYCIENPSKRFYYALIATLSSTVTAVIGYCLGLYLWDMLSPYVLDHIISSSFFHRIEIHYAQYESWAVALGSLLPLPFKAITLSAGACKLSFSLFLMAVFMGRAIRFFALSELMNHFGSRLKLFMQNYFSKAMAVIGLKIALTAAVIWILQ